MISDSYDLKDVDGIVFEADCAMIEEGAVNVGPYFPSFCIHLINMLWPVSVEAERCTVRCLLTARRHWCECLCRRG